MRADGARRDRGEIGEKACKSTIKKDDMTKFFLKKMQRKCKKSENFFLATRARLTAFFEM